LSAILSAVIFNALVIIALIPLALKGVAYRPIGAAAMLRRNLFIYGFDGTVRGSALLAQNFSSDKYFQPRPSAAGNGYDSTSSGGTNLGPTSAKLANGVHAKDANGKDVSDPGNFDGVKDLVA